MIASGSGDGRIRLWDSVTGACTASLGDVGGPQDGVTSVVLKQASGCVGGGGGDLAVVGVDGDGFFSVLLVFVVGDVGGVGGGGGDGGMW